MKRLLLILSALLLSIAISSQARMPIRTIKMKGKIGYLPTSSVSVGMSQNNTLITRFNSNIKDVTVTVTKENGEVVFTETINAEEFDSVMTEIKDYVPGSYTIEIEAPEGSLEGKF